MENSLWDDSDCTVEEQYNSHTKINSLKSTCQFNNMLLSNKGDISTARILSLRSESVGSDNSINSQSSWNSYEDYESIPATSLDTDN